MRVISRSMARLIGAATVIAGLAFASSASARDQSRNAGPHGALQMDVQQQRLGELQRSHDVTKPPAGIDPVFWEEVLVPADNRMTPERVELGRRLFFETRLSADGTVACATCHDVSRSFTDQRPVSEGIRDQLGHRNAPTTMNAFFMQTQFWDGRAASLEKQAELPILNAIEMGQPDRDAAIAAIQGNPEYRRLFQAAYGSEPNYGDLAKAIAAFERTLVFLDAPFERFLAGKQDAISADAKKGWDLFNGKARCASCHTVNSANLSGSDSRFHNVGVAARTRNFEALAKQALRTLQEEGGTEKIDELALQTEFSELGRFLVTKNRADIGAFKTEQLRNVGITGPYMHDGSMRTLWDVMDHYNKGGEANPYLDGGIEPLALSEGEINAVVALMFAMTDDRFAEQNRKAFDEQRKIAAQRRPFRDTALAMREVLPFERRVMGEPEKGSPGGR